MLRDSKMFSRNVSNFFPKLRRPYSIDSAPCRQSHTHTFMACHDSPDMFEGFKMIPDFKLFQEFYAMTH